MEYISINYDCADKTFNNLIEYRKSLNPNIDTIKFSEELIGSYLFSAYKWKKYLENQK